jgi:hypothetical protein
MTVALLSEFLAFPESASGHRIDMILLPNTLQINELPQYRPLNFLWINYKTRQACRVL